MCIKYDSVGTKYASVGTKYASVTGNRGIFDSKTNIHKQATSIAGSNTTAVATNRLYFRNKILEKIVALTIRDDARSEKSIPYIVLFSR